MGVDIVKRYIYIDHSEERQLKKEGTRDVFAHATLAVDKMKQKIRIRYRGGHTRFYPKKSYEIRIGRRTIHYNAELDDPSMIRNSLSFSFFEKLGVVSPRTRHVNLVINGVSQGLYLEIEGVDHSFFSKRRVRASALLYAANNNANFRLQDEHKKSKRSLASGYEFVIGDGNESARFTRFIRNIHRLKQEALLAYLKKHLDIPQYLRWLAGAVCTGNYDGFDQNYALYRTAGKAKYHISPWDYEGTWGRNCYGEINSSQLVRITGYNGLTEKLLSFPSIRRAYKRLLQNTLDKQFTLQALQPVITSIHNDLFPHLINDPTRKHSAYEVAADLDVFIRYIRERRAYITEELSKL